MDNKELANTVRVKVGELNRVLKEAMENDLRVYLRVYLNLEKSSIVSTEYQTKEIKVDRINALKEY
ncbi:hypothetical protein LCGC14_0570520 [marine sediment metagenome]|uniref:Uncharacterized protein n=1 Tax=marine sediment metagenome TaxID=412755 RepID=A0A0F9RJE3_9ZZZZ